MNAHRCMLAGVAVAAACGGRAAPVPSAGCEAVWAEAPARAFVELLLAATASDEPVWEGYDLGRGSYVLHAGASTSGAACLGLFQDGRAVAYTSVAAEPVLLTPLYGYYFDAAWHGAPDVPMLENARQPSSVRRWLEPLGVKSAVVLPVTVENFPIELPPLVKVQLAIHEAFHVEVQAPRWHASAGAWPAWERQPDRPGLQACYTATDEVQAALERERAALTTLVTRLLDGDSARACTAGATFLARRAARYALGADIRVARHDSTAGTCREAEAIMELEEGTADFASWTVLYDIGLADRDVLLRRYQARQNDVFYLTGAMQLHAAQLMAPQGRAAIVREIVGSERVDEGSPTAVLERSLRSYCR